jgi:hypothetical protein
MDAREPPRALKVHASDHVHKITGTSVARFSNCGKLSSSPHYHLHMVTYVIPELIALGMVKMCGITYINLYYETIRSEVSQLKDTGDLYKKYGFHILNY